MIKKTLNMKLAELQHPEKNVRKHSKKQISEMKRSIEMFGQFRPIVVDEGNTILAGNGLVTAMREMGIEEAEVIKYEGMTDNQKKKLMIADNQIASLGTDDMEVIEEFIKSLDGDLDVPGYDEETLEMLVAEADAVTEQVMEYGIYTQEEVESVRKFEEQPIKPVEQTYQPPVQRAGVTESQFSGAVNTPYSEGSERVSSQMEREQYVICPKCGEKIWLE